MAKKCRVCLFENKDEAIFCEQCHSRIFNSFYEWFFSADYPKPFVFDDAKMQWRFMAGVLAIILLVCSLGGCLPGIVYGRVLFPREVQRTSLVRETVVVTATSPPTPIGPTSSPTVTSTPTPIPTETPTPTPLPTTPPGTELEPGQIWVEDGLAVRMDVAAIKPRQLLVDLTIRNIDLQPKLFEIQATSFRMVSNTGDIVGPPTNVYGELIHGWYGGSVSLEPGEIFEVTKGGGFIQYNLAESNVTQVWVEVVGLSKVDKARWKVVLPK